tara:strand:+ start:202 stop:552 length:351 start_codon:yes stop_codon:yes gene_type:complete
MDERLEKALEFGNFTKTLNDQRRMLTEKYHEDLIFFYQGAQFTLTQTLISFVATLIQTGNNTSVIVDDNNTPIRIDNLKDFNEDILNSYTIASNSYFTEYQQIKSNRSIEKLISHE